MLNKISDWYGSALLPNFSANDNHVVGNITKASVLGAGSLIAISHGVGALCSVIAGNPNVLAASLVVGVIGTIYGVKKALDGVVKEVTGRVPRAIASLGMETTWIPAIAATTCAATLHVGAYNVGRAVSDEITAVVAPHLSYGYDVAETMDILFFQHFPVNVTGIAAGSAVLTAAAAKFMLTHSGWKPPQRPADPTNGPDTGNGNNLD